MARYHYQRNSRTSRSSRTSAAPVRRNQRDSGTGSRRHPALIILGVGLLFGGWGVLASPLFAIQTITVSEAQYLDAQAVQLKVQEQFTKRRWWFFPQSNLVAFSKGQARERLAEEYPFAEFNFNKQLPDKLVVTIKEQEPLLVWRSGGNQWYVSAIGQVVGLVPERFLAQQVDQRTNVIRPQLYTNGLMSVNDTSSHEVTLGQNLLSSEFVTFITRLQHLIEQNADFSVVRYTVDRPGSDQLILQTSEGWQAKFRVSDDPDLQVSRLLLVLKNKIKDPSTIDYVDLRFGEKIFFK